MKRLAFLLVLVLVGLLVAPSVALGAEDPRIETAVPEDTLVPGQTTQLAVEFLNDAEDLDDQVKPATEVYATMTPGDTSFAVLSGTHRLAPLQDGQPVVDRFQVRVPQNAEAGTYRLPIELEYVYDRDETETRTVYATVRIERRASFSIVDTTAALEVGESDSVAVTVENDGTENVSDATVTLRSATGNVVFGSSPATTAYVGNWSVGDRETVTVDAAAPPSADAGNYSLSAIVEYENSEGFARTAAPMTLGVEVAPERDQFTLADVEHSLRVGEEGELSMTVTNGDEAVSDAVLRLTGVGTNVHPLSNEYALGDLEAGASVPVSFPIEISESAEATPRQFGFTMEYENADGDTRAQSLSVQATLEPERDRFVIEPLNATVQAGSSGTITVAVTNNGDTPVEDVNAKLFTNDPLSSGDDEAYVQSLPPGETETIAFGISAAGSAIEKAYPVSMDFQYDANGDSKLSKTYQVPISVTVAESSGPSPWVIGGVVGVVLVAAVILFYYRRQ